MADTPAPDPVEALLAGVETAAGTGHVEYVDALADAAPRLARIVRVLRDALGDLVSMGEHDDGSRCDPRDCGVCAQYDRARADLSRVREIAEGK